MSTSISFIVGIGTSTSNGDGGPATSAAINQGRGVWTDSLGEMYIAEYNSHKVRRVLGSGIIINFAGSGNAGFSGDGNPPNIGNVNLQNPTYAIGDSAGNIFIADYSNHRIRKVDRSTNIISTFAGNGNTGESTIGFPTGLAMDGSSENLYVSTQSYCGVYKINLSTGSVTQYVGNSAGCTLGSDAVLATSTSIATPFGIWIDTAGLLYLVEHAAGDASQLRYVDASGILRTAAGGEATGTSAGDGGLAINATVNVMYGVYGDGLGNIYVTDDSTIRRICQISGDIDTYTSLSGVLYSVFASSDGAVYASTYGGYLSLSSLVSRIQPHSQLDCRQPSLARSPQPSPQSSPVLHPSWFRPPPHLRSLRWVQSATRISLSVLQQVL